MTEPRERVGFSPSRVMVVALNTFIEAIRQKVFNVFLIVALLAIASASFFSQFTFAEQIKFVKDFCLGAISFVGALIAIAGTAQLLPNEMENRTIYTILAKPVRRVEFLLGKYMGSFLLVLISVLLMALMLGAALVFKEHKLVAETLRQAQQAPESIGSPEQVAVEVNRIRAEARDPDLVKALILIFVKLELLAAITLLLSTFSTSMVFNVVTGVIVFVVGNLVGIPKEMWAEHRVAIFFLQAIPDLRVFAVADDIVLGNKIAWAYVGQALVDGLVRGGSVLAAAQLIFSRREF